MNKELFRNMDYQLALTTVALIVIGIVMIYSASTSEQFETGDIWQRQLVWAIFSVAAMLAIIPVQQKYFYIFAYFLYGIGIVLLIATHFFGTMGGGSERWLTLGLFRFQPSEFMKVSTVLALARYLSYKQNMPTTYGKCIIPTLIVLVPMVIVYKQPDLGTSLVFAGLLLPMLFWAGLDTLRMFFVVAPAISAVFTAPFIPMFNPVAWVLFMFVVIAALLYARYSFSAMGLVLGANILAGIATPIVFNHLSPYQQKRITTVFNPEADPQGSGYQITNSMTAIGSGGFFGKGFGEGRYTELGYLPRAHTDFIFSVVGEELGFLGALAVLALFFYLIVRIIMIATEVKSRFTSMAAIGFATVFAFHVFINIGMVVGIMPVTGLPLPFLSYGGSSCLTNAIMIGLLLNFRVHRHEM